MSELQKYKQVKLKSRFSIMELSTLYASIQGSDVQKFMPEKHLKEIQRKLHNEFYRIKGMDKK